MNCKMFQHIRAIGQKTAVFIWHDTCRTSDWRAQRSRPTFLMCDSQHRVERAECGALRGTATCNLQSVKRSKCWSVIQVSGFPLTRAIKILRYFPDQGGTLPMFCVALLDKYPKMKFDATCDQMNSCDFSFVFFSPSTARD